MLPGDTIAALATPWGEGALGVVRISGPDAFEVCRRIGGLGPGAAESHRARVRTLHAPHDRADVLDQALVLPFVGPASFTGEDVVELHCHGGDVTLRRVLDALAACDVRTAEPGEFSRRALLNGKLDVVQVEAIADVIHAESEAAQRLAQSHLAGRLSNEIDALKAALAELVTLVEAAIDFSLEEHVYSISAESIVERLTPVRDGIAALLATYDAGRMRRDGVRVAIVGPPNAGKSTLLNRLLREERAIVTAVAGTTRDTIEESLALDGVRYHLVDTAGIRSTDDVVEALGVERSRRALAEADVALLVVDAGDWAAASPLLPELAGLPWLLLVNQVDRVPDLGVLDAAEASLDGPGRRGTLRVSLREDASSVAQVEVGLRGLAEAAGLRPGSESVLLSRARHRELLMEASSVLETAQTAAESELGHELIALDLRLGLDALGALTGAVTSDDVLARIFGDFCIGK